MATTMAATDFERDVRRLDGEIALLASAALDGPLSRYDATRLAWLQYQRAMLLGSWADLAHVEAVLAELIERHGPHSDLCLLKAMLDLTCHRTAAVRADLALAPALARSWHGRALEADVLVQEGRYDDAHRAYERVLLEARTWENLARLAHLHALVGERREADRLYAEAAEEITAKAPRSYAWVELMRGQLDQGAGAFDAAAGHYGRAQAAYSGYWLVEAQWADLLAAQGQSEQAIAIYEDVIARAPRPELIKALGDVYAAVERSDEARAHHDRALAGYLASARSGGGQYLHHLAAFYADVRGDGPEAVRWARRDCELRPGAATEAALAWAEYRRGRLDEARRLVRHALASGVRSAHVLRQSATIHRACGDLTTAEEHARLAAQLGPSVAGAHAHL